MNILTYYGIREGGKNTFSGKNNQRIINSLLKHATNYTMHTRIIVVINKANEDGSVPWILYRYQNIIQLVTE